MYQAHSNHEFDFRVVLQVNKIKIGPPLSEGTKLGPLVNKSQQLKVLGFIDRARASGVKVNEKWVMERTCYFLALRQR